MAEPKTLRKEGLSGTLEVRVDPDIEGKGVFLDDELLETFRSSDNAEAWLEGFRRGWQEANNE